ncbi:Uncharacterised protein [Enterobacter hormaechei]|nr:Uncharacterised protein [Enterobacter hormaechei]VAE26925.1 Uncharacterised protein [Enterobacter hormaechei]
MSCLLANSFKNNIHTHSGKNLSERVDFLRNKLFPEKIQ